MLKGGKLAAHDREGDAAKAGAIVAAQAGGAIGVAGNPENGIKVLKINGAAGSCLY
ncbi:hypothetical protein [Borrelia sp. P9F1]|uniref:hypothetical protein n=1 Tax=Borrelia sp. P9F1 TaxID=3058374 RepID=UPI00345E2507